MNLYWFTEDELIIVKNLWISFVVYFDQQVLECILIFTVHVYDDQIPVGCFGSYNRRMIIAKGEVKQREVNEVFLKEYFIASIWLTWELIGK